MRPNVLLVVFDTARADTLEPYGAASGSTPAVAELARRGAALRGAYSTSNWTLPSHASMFSGLLPRQVWADAPPSGSPQDCRPAISARETRLLPEVLRQHGYATAGFSANVWVSPHSGLDAGFERFEYVNVEREVRMEEAATATRRQAAAWALEGLRATGDDGAGQARDRLTAWIAEAEERPRFWFVNLLECHSPYLPPRPWNDLSARDRVRAALEAKRHLSFEAIVRTCAGNLPVPEAALERMRHLQRRSASYLDRWLADVLEALDARGILDETLVIVTSDHGENFGEDGLLAHAFSLDERLIHVPLVWAGPGAEDEQRVVSLAELPRLVARATGIDGRAWQRPPVEGPAIAQLDPLGGREHPRLREFVARWGIDSAGVERLTAPITAAVDGRRKLVRRGEATHLYDLHDDPLEQRPLPGDVERQSVGPLHEALEQHAERAPDAAAAATPAPANADEAAELEQRMRLLGYL